MGFVIVIALGLYVLISIGVVAWSINYAKKNGKSAIRWGLSAVLVMYLIPFGDWIQTVITHKYYCSTEAGFWVYKTPEQWKAENPGVMEVLQANKPPISVSSQDDNGNNWSYTDKLNQRINYISVTKDYGPFFTHMRRSTTELTDATNSAVLGRYVDFSSSGRKRRADWPWRFWLEADHCESNLKNIVQVREFKEQFKGNEK